MGLTLRVKIDPAFNLDFSEWGEAFAGDRILGAATLDRLRHGAYRIVLDGDTFRAPKPMPEPDQTRGGHLSPRRIGLLSLIWIMVCLDSVVRQLAA
ncbi:hypothetical protein OKW46_006451 [Paraburkholderia sp. WSM4179]|nr:hypothetical protein [Paraburkholderia sp. WSM4179]